MRPEDLPAPAQRLAEGASDDGAPDDTGPTASTGSDGASDTRPGSATTGSTSRAGPSGGGATSTTPTSPSYRVVVDVADPTGDAGVQARPYGDLVRVRVQDDGTRARVTVSFAGELPAPPADGEVIGVGVDVFRTNDDESDYQLYALGNADGWRAGVQSGDDWVDYPGTFELGADRLVFTLPWSSLGGRRPGAVSVFADWSKSAVAVVAEASEDHLPDRGSHPFSF